MSASYRRALRLLHLEDDRYDAELVVQTLADAGFDCEEVRVQTEDEFRAALDSGRPIDIILADWALPSFDGERALAIARKVRPDLPFILISGKVGEDLAIDMLHAGATDYVLKQRLARLPPAVTRALREREREHEHQRVSQELAVIGASLQRTQLLEFVMDQMPAGVIVANAPDGRILALNPQALNLLGVPTGSLQRLDDLARLAIYLPDGNRAAPEDLPSLRALRRGEIVRDVLLEYRHGGERSVFVQVGARPVRNETGSVIAVVTTYADVTARRNEETLLRQRSEFREQLVEIVGHDLRIPLAAIEASARLLAQGVPDGMAAGRAPLDAIERSLERVNRMVQDLLDFAKARLGPGIPVQLHRTELRSLCETALEELRLAAGRRPILLVAREPSFAYVDPDRFIQLVTNLVTTALSLGAPDRPVRVTLRDVNGAAEVEVRSEGSPLAAEVLSTLFEPVWRGPQVDGERHVGPGLFIAQEIARAHQASLEARVSDASATTLTLRLPSYEGQRGTTGAAS
ncbi:MAG TPA: ATP-binding protein [Anaeromyxobacteraceae bacterium]|nr:ATP-binding protein [Anaeromyxobacteraceae bacterium]